MIIDCQHGDALSEIEADLCVIGAGPAGIAIARAYIGTSLRIYLIESGGTGGEESSQQLNNGESIGDPALDPGTSRMRVFGGSCNLWGGGCIALNPLDLERRDWVEHSGWPLSHAELAPHYARAHAFCQIESRVARDGSFTAPKHAPLDFDESRVVNQTFVRSPVRFGAAYRDELAHAPNVTVLLHATVLALDADTGGTRVQQARISTPGGRNGTVRARHYVLACGGIENARLLLLSDNVMTEGLGNQHDLVGRYFMDHPSGKLGELHARGGDRHLRPYDRGLRRGAVPSLPEICLSDAAQRTRQLLHGRVHPFAVEGPLPAGIRALRELRGARPIPSVDENARVETLLCTALNHRVSPHVALAGKARNAPGRALRLGTGALGIARAYVRKLADLPTVASSHIDLIGYFEQAPNPASRVLLGGERDALGQRRICVDWRLTALDRHTYRSAAALFGAELARTCGGQFQLEPWLADGDDAPAQVHTTAHHLGTTRMSDDPRRGVVDRDCRVHGMHNLHVSGSSVFPTGGWAFPTLTIIALSLRLADHLHDKLRAGNEPLTTALAQPA